ncbi:hypothetical protein CFPU101_37980 [Chroococcus sp. FPU101]|nr:hypothetical protein CFPU101_37980 [Chroococcus sp. FPU101]
MNLRFLGFHNLSPATKANYKNMFLDDVEMNNLKYWDQFEEEYPNTFIAIYNSWCQKQD